MADYIDRASIYKKIAELEELARKRYLDTPCDSPCYQRYLAQMQERGTLKHLIADAPAADVEPVRHGEWLLRHIGHGHYWECSECHTNPCIYVTENTKFCPNCGAKMDLGEHKNDN